jgi:outer membrane biosynthesis protein TonB
VRAILALTVWSVAAGAGAVAQSELPRVVIADSSVKPGDPQFVWLPSAVSVAPALRGGIRLVYPDSLRRKGISGRVLLEFVVDTLGRVEPGVRVLETADPLLVGPAKQMLQEARYAPGRVHGRPVRVLVRMGLNVAPRSP